MAEPLQTKLLQQLQQLAAAVLSLLVQCCNMAWLPSTS
jgi:hypothetical protein